MMPEFAARYTAAWCSQDGARVAGFFAPDGGLTIDQAEYDRQLAGRSNNALV